MDFMYIYIIVLKWKQPSPNFAADLEAHFYHDFIWNTERQLQTKRMDQ